MAACRFYRDPLRKVNFISSKTVVRLVFEGIKTSENKVLSTKTNAGSTSCFATGSHVEWPHMRSEDCKLL